MENPLLADDVSNFTATEAKNLSEVKKLDFTPILRKIKKKALKGETEMWYYEKLTDEAKEYLTQLGYTLSEETMTRNELHIKISW